MQFSTVYLAPIPKGEQRLWGILYDVYSRNVLLGKVGTASNTTASVPITFVGLITLDSTNPIFLYFVCFFGLCLSSMSGIYDLFILAPNTMPGTYSRYAHMLVELNCGTKYIFCSCWFTLSKNHYICFSDKTGPCPILIHYRSWTFFCLFIE